MADITLHTTNAGSVTCVSNIFIDDFMISANGEFVKTYLYLLRCLGRDGYVFTISDVADRLNHTEADVIRALNYWENVGVLRLERNLAGELSGIELVDVSGYVTSIAPVTITAPAPVAPAVNVVTPEITTVTIPQKRSYTPEELDSFSSDDEVQELLYVSSTYIGRPLSISETQSILYWHDSLQMPIDLIEYLIETCVSNGHTSFHYMETVACNWVEDGINSVEAAKNSAKAHSTAVYTVMKSFGISGRDLIPEEQEYIDKWTNVFHFGLDIISEACRRTIQQTNKPRFKYADSILSSWSENGVRSLEDISQLDAKHMAKSVAKVSTQPTATQRSKTSNKSFVDQRSYSAEDYARFETMMS